MQCEIDGSFHSFFLDANSSRRSVLACMGALNVSKVLLFLKPEGVAQSKQSEQRNKVNVVS